jgi:hypothetical protein
MDLRKLTSAPMIAVHLDHAGEKLLHGAAALLDPGLLIARPEELRGLNNRNVGFFAHEGEDLLEEVVAGAEVGVEDGEEPRFSRRM